MGIDLYILAENADENEDIGFCSRNLASEIDILSALGKGTLVDFIVYGEEICEGEDEYLDPTPILKAAQKTLALVSKKDESDFTVDKGACLEELKDMIGVIQKAVDAKVKISVTIA